MSVEAVADIAEAVRRSGRRTGDGQANGSEEQQWLSGPVRRKKD